MKNIITILLMSIATVSYGQQKKFSQMTAASSVDANSWFVGVKISGGTGTDYRFSISQLASYIGSSSSLNFANTNLTVTGARQHDFAKYSMRMLQINSMLFKDTLNRYYLNMGGIGGTNDSSLIWISHPSANSSQVKIASIGGETFTQVFNDGTNKIARLTSTTNTTLQLITGASTCVGSILVGGIYSFHHDSVTSILKLGNQATNKGFQIHTSTGAITVNNVYTFPTAAATNTNMHITSTASACTWQYVVTTIDDNPIDANYTITQPNTTVFLPDISAGRNLTLPTGVAGTMLEIVNQNTTGFDWSFVGTVKDYTGATITVIPVGVRTIRYTGTYWLLVSKEG